MFDKWRRYSYAAQKNQRGKILYICLCFLVLYILYNVLTTFFFSMRVLENETMLPGLQPGDRFVFSSFAACSFFPGADFFNRPLPFKRGNIVLVEMGRDEKRGLPLLLLDGFVRFFTAQRLSLLGMEDQVYVKRVIGLPGDELTMTNFVFRVKPAADPYSLTEFELSDILYEIAIPHVPALWDDSIPFSGNMDRIVLGENECFVVSDDRSNTNDSRTWGPVSANLIAGKALFRCWPLTRLGTP
ncbi:MAG: signal peptidase I [Treponema sp.]|jgi:signal peptidase I|nr:signal peptidase I [Treponema sp.]